MCVCLLDFVIKNCGQCLLENDVRPDKRLRKDGIYFFSFFLNQNCTEIKKKTSQYENQ